MEDAVVAVGAYGEGLSVVLEGVGWGFGALVDDGELAALLEEIEGGVGADAVDAAGGYVAGDAEVADVGFVAHAVEFADGDVVALVVAAAGEGEVGDGRQDDDGGDDDLERALLGRGRHSVPLSLRRFGWRGKTRGSRELLNKKGLAREPFCSCGVSTGINVAIPQESAWESRSWICCRERWI